MLTNLGKFSTIAASLTISVYSSSCLAADGNITFNGKVVAASCDVATESKDFTVSLPTISDTALGGEVDVTAGHTAFKISLENCESQTSTAEKVRVAFSGVADDNNIYVLKNTALGTAATGVGLQLYLQDGVTKIDINNGSNKDTEFLIPAVGSSNSYDLNYIVAYVNTIGNSVSAGDVQAIATYSVEYN